MDATFIASHWLYFLMGWVVFSMLIFVGQLITLGLWATENALCIMSSILSILFTILCGLLSTVSFTTFIFSLGVFVVQMFQ
jgi:hypothetical protein